MFKKLISSGITFFAIVGFALGAIGCTQQNVIQATDTPLPPPATLILATPSSIPATSTPLPAKPTTILPSATSLPPTSTLAPAKVIDLTKDQIETLDLQAVDSDFGSLYNGFTDGKIGYFLPNDILNSGKLARVDLQSFSANKVTVLDLSTSDPKLKGFQGGFIEGQYAYLAPFTYGVVARVDLQNFTNSGVTSLDLTAVDKDMVQFKGGFSDGHYGYFAPWLSKDGPMGKVARVDLQNFTTSGVTVLDLTKVNIALTAFSYGFMDGQYAYLTPFNSNAGGVGQLVRLDLQNFTPNGVTLLDLSKVDNRIFSIELSFTDGHYGYMMGSRTYQYPIMTRVDLSNFTTSGVTIIDLTKFLNDNAVGGGYAVFANGHYGYYNLDDGLSGGLGRVAQVDLQNFTPGGVTILNFETADSRLNELWSGFTDGQYLYFESQNTGLVVRIKPDFIQ